MKGRSPRRRGHPISRILRAIIDRELTDNPATFLDLVRAAGLDPTRDFVGASLRDLDLHGEDLRGFDFSGADLAGANLQNTNVDGVSFSGATLTGAIGLPPRASPPNRRREFCVSYAWGDDSPEGHIREEVVDKFCTEAERRGFRIVRDRTDMALGASISEFSRRIGRAERVLVVLSNKYLRSPYCMGELFEIWRNSRADGAAFLRRVRVYIVPGTLLETPQHRAHCAAFWQDQYHEIDELVKHRGPSILGIDDFEKYKLMQDFAHRVGDVLSIVTDRIQPRSFLDLERHGLDDWV